MQIRQHRLPIAVADYLAKERALESVIRHEYLDGSVLAMAGESFEHSTIGTNLIYLIVGQLRGKPCRALSPNMKVRTTPDNPSLQNVIAACLADAYDDARYGASDETGLPISTFPETCPYTFEQVLDQNFVPS